MTNRTLDIAKARSPITWVPSVYFGMGLPYIILSIISVLLFSDLGVSKAELTFWTSLIVLPWSLKPFFSVVMEVFGTKREYIIFTEFITSLMLGLVCFALQLPAFFAISMVLMAVIGFSGSVHDIAGDGIYMQELTEKQQGNYAGWQGAFYNLAKLLGNGALVYLAGKLSATVGVKWAWTAIMALCAGIMLLVALYHIWSLPKEKASARQVNLQQGLDEFGRIVVSFFQKKYIWVYLAFIFCYRFAEGLAIKIAPIFLKDTVANGGIGLTNENYGIAYGIGGTIAFVVGSILSGYYISHFGLKKTLFSLVCIFNIPFAVYLIFALLQPQSFAWVSVGIIFEYFSYGFGYVGLTLFMMQQIAPGKYQMAHYAFANSLTNLSVLVPGMISGVLADELGYSTFFTLVMFVTIPAILFSLFLPFTRQEEAETSESVAE